MISDVLQETSSSPVYLRGTSGLALIDNFRLDAWVIFSERVLLHQAHAKALVNPTHIEYRNIIIVGGLPGRRWDSRTSESHVRCPQGGRTGAHKTYCWCH